VTLPTYGATGTYLTGTTTTSAAVAVPSSAAVNSIMIVQLYKENSAAVTPPAGFTELTPVQSTTTDVPFTMHVFWKRCTAADSGTYSFSWTGSVWREAVCTRYEGVVTSGTPMEQQSGQQTSANTQTTSAVSVTTVAYDTLLVWMAGASSTGAWTPPTNFTERFDNGNTLSNATRDWATPGGSGSVTGTGPFNSKVAWLVSLRPRGPANPDNPWARRRPLLVR
jgi:hypothetical protein